MAILDTDVASAPYVGLRPFREDESYLFFGREGQIDRLLLRLRDSRFLAIVGPSGCGKSSLVRAGMLAAIRSGFMAGTGAWWTIAEMRPGNRPLGRLAAALAASGVLNADGRATPAVPLVEAMLRRGPLGLVEVLRGAGGQAPGKLLLLVDQFEEIFRFREGNADEADAFVALLLQSVRQEEAPVYVVLTMRSDFLGETAIFPGLPEALSDSQFVTPRLTRDQSREAIVGPARIFGGDLEDVLVTRMLNDLGTEPDQLPVLQHALMRMWDVARTEQGLPPFSAAAILGGLGTPQPVRLSLELYDRIGGLTSALSRHADEAFGELSPRQQQIAEVLFRLLAERTSNGQDIRRPVRMGIAAEVAGATPEEVAEVVEAFRREDRSFLTPPVGTPLGADTVVDISHESLIRQWKRLADWVAREADSAEKYRDLVRSARRWRTDDEEPLRGRALDRMADWKQRGETVEWARRYGTDGDFELAAEYLERSLEERKAREDQAREEKERAFRAAVADAEEKERALRQKSRLLDLATILTVAFGIALLSAGYFLVKARSLTESLRTSNGEAVSATRAAVLAKKEADSLRALAQGVYYDSAGDAAARRAYYGGLSPSGHSPAEAFDAISKLLYDTHTKHRPYAPTSFLSSGPDLRPDLVLRSIYSGEAPSDEKPYLNTELVVPDVWFRQQATMRGDLHNQFTIELYCNRFRGTAPLTEYAPADRPRLQNQPGCGWLGGKGFEPEAGKGPVARATLYFLLRYPGTIGSRYYSPAAIETFRAWSRADPVTRYELHRNATIQKVQGNRNPLVDHPEWVDRIDFAKGLGR
jgi:hypothetical protein